jgi:hypothetical protein
VKLVLATLEKSRRKDEEELFLLELVSRDFQQGCHVHVSKKFEFKVLSYFVYFITMARIHRVLIKTHHITSTKKIQAITKAAKSLSCSVILKTGGWPGIMLAEGERAGEWMKVVRVSWSHHVFARN